MRSDRIILFLAILGACLAAAVLFGGCRHPAGDSPRYPIDILVDPVTEVPYVAP